MPPLLCKLENVNLTWRPSGVRACRQVNLDISAGEIHALAGENGAGKTTLGHILGGVLTPDSGILKTYCGSNSSTINLADKKPGILPGTGLVRQRSIWPRNLEIWEAAILGRQRKISRKSIINEFLKTAEKWELDKIPPRKKTAQINAPELQQAELTSALMANPELLILDEPSLVWEEGQSKSFERLMNKLKESNLGILLITHRIEDVFKFADRVTVMREGQIEGTWETKSINKKYLLEQMFSNDACTDSGPAESWPAESEPANQGLVNSKPADSEKEEAEKDFSKPETKGTSAAPVLEIKNINLTYSGRQELSNISFSIYPGEILAVAGLWNEGLRALEDVVCGIKKTGLGTISITGKVQSHGIREMRAAGMGYVPSDITGRGAALTLPAAENMAVPAIKVPGDKGPASRSKIYEWANERLKESGILGKSSQLLSEFSGGTIQRIILQREILSAKSILILANPSKGLDENNRKVLFKSIRKLAEENLAILLLTPVPEEAILLSDRMGVIRNGCISVLKDSKSWNIKEAAEAMVREL